MEALEIETIEPHEAKRPPQGDRVFSRAELEHCAAQAIMLRRYREHGFSLLSYARRAEPWRYGGRGPTHGVVRQHREKIRSLVDEALQLQGGDVASVPSAEELRTAERINALLAMDAEALGAAIVERGRQPTADQWSNVMLAFSLGVCA